MYDKIINFAARGLAKFVEASRRGLGLILTFDLKRVSAPSDLVGFFNLSLFKTRMGG